MSLPLFLASCSDDDVPADADENFITAVTLATTDASYDAVIGDGTITVTVPYTVSLDGAKASFVYTPSAKIYPDPQEISDWNSERVFRVVSYNGAERQYKYLVVKDEIRENGDVVLATEEEIAAFAEKGTSVVNGNLTIGTADGPDITSLAGLENLKEISGQLIILNSYKSVDLTGLESLKSVGGVTIGSEDASSSTALQFFSLNGLEAVNGDINLYANSIEYVDFKGLTGIDGSVNIVSSALNSIQADKLVDVAGDFTVSCRKGNVAGGAIKEFSLPELVNVGGSLTGSDFTSIESVYFPKLRTAGDIVFEALPFSLSKIDFPEIETVNGDMSFVSLTSFQAIGSVTSGNTNLQSFEGFNNLKEVKGTMTIANFSEVTNIPGVSKAIIGAITMSRMEKITELDLSNTTFVKSDKVEDCDLRYSWMQITKIKGQRTLDCNLIIENANMVEGLPVLENVETIKGIYVGQPYTSSDLTLSSPVKEITGNLHIDMCTYSKTVNVDFQELTKIGGYAFISSVERGTKYNIFFPNLTVVGGQFYAVGGGILNYNLSALKEVSLNTTSTDLLKIEVLFGYDEEFKLGMGFNAYFIQGPNIVLDSIEKVGGKGMKLNLCYDFTPMDSFSCPKLTSISKELFITSTPYEDDKLSVLSFPLLVSLPKVNISLLGNLRDFSTFGTLFTNGQIAKAEDWSVSGCAYNPTFDDMKAGRYKPAE